MPVAIARKLLPPRAIIGVSCTTPEHVRKAVEDGADYVGLGAVYATSTKYVSAPGRMCGIAGVRTMLSVLKGTRIQAVAIGRQPPPDGDTKALTRCRWHKIDEHAPHTAQLRVSRRPLL